MVIPVPAAVQQTAIFTGCLLAALLISLRVNRTVSFSKEATTELKGFAILAVVFAHIGYYLAQDTRFLFPLSILAGVGVNVFLFLSGYGLTHSVLRHPLSVREFYQKRLGKVFPPLWALLILLLGADWLVLHQTYSFTTIWHSFIGYFPKADLYSSIDAPLWYFTYIVGYYVVYPLVFVRKNPLITAGLLAIIGYGLVNWIPLPVDAGVLGTYKSHIFAFPLGTAVAALWLNRIRWVDTWTLRIKTFLERAKWSSYLVRAVGLVLCASVFTYYSLHANIGQGAWAEQSASLISMFALIGCFLLKPVDSRFLYLAGLFSYEIYLLHWPLLYRYGVFYEWVPAWLATFAYVFVFFGLGAIFQRFTNKRITKQN